MTLELCATLLALYEVQYQSEEEALSSAMCNGNSRLQREGYGVHVSVEFEAMQ